MDSLSSADIPPNRPHRRKRGRWGLRLTGVGVAILMAANLALLALIAWPIVQARARLAVLPLGLDATLPAIASASPTPSRASEATSTLLSSETPTLPPASPSPLPPAPYPLSADSQAAPAGLIVLALAEGLDTHLFAYLPQKMPLTRLTDGAWDDITPAISPDGGRVAFASNRSGYWDLYLLELSTGEVARLTDGLEFDAAPSWSPDGRWIVYETYSPSGTGGLDLFIRPVDGGQAPIRLTEHPAPDTSPAWSPQGRQVAFLSTRSGEPEVWLADLDQAGEERFRNLSRDAGAIEAHPIWSPDGLSLAWAAVEGGFHDLRIWEHPLDGEEEIRTAGSGDWPAWSPDGQILLTVLYEPNRTYLAAYPFGAPGLVWPPLLLPGPVAGIAWGDAQLSLPLGGALEQAARQTPARLWSAIKTPDPEIPGGRGRLVDLKDIQAPYAMLHDEVDESFQALRAALAHEIGWDLLSSLENAYVPLTDTLDPGLGDDWLYTGRAFAFTSLPVNAGWMAIVREDFGPQTYWRVYLRARYQDGSAGMALSSQPWDLAARTRGDPATYEQGGDLAQVPPPGYWVDFTRFAAAFGWERLPALIVWRSSFPAARFNEYVLPSGLDWRAAMLDLYPPEALITPTVLIPPTRTFTPTPRWFQTRTSTPTATPRPTLTPLDPSPTSTSLPATSPPPRPTATPTRSLALTPTLTAAFTWTTTPAASQTPTP